MKNRRDPRFRRARCAGYSFAVLVALIVPGTANSQQIVTRADQTIQVERGKSALIRLASPAVRISLADPAVADFTLHDAIEVELRGVQVGTTSLILWLASGAAQIYTIDVVPDIAALQDQLRTLFPRIDLQVTTSGNNVIVSGAVNDPTIVRRTIELAEATGATVINNIQAPSAEQILLHVRFAEVRRSALERLGSDLFAQNVGNLQGVVGDGSETDITTLSEGIVQLFLLGQDARLDAVIRALRSTGDFKSLAEPNLIALEGQEATFLAGGEFPYPIVQPGAQSAVTIAFKEFGIRLRFTPNVTNSGAIRLHVAPEVSALDFANGLTISGFQIPSLVTRRTESDVELMPGQHLAIAGLLDNSMAEAIDKIPLLGDLPIIGGLFRSRLTTQDRTELLVLVTPYIVQPTNVPPPLPTGEPAQWRWNRHLGPPPDTTRTMGTIRRNGNDNR